MKDERPIEICYEDYLPDIDMDTDDIYRIKERLSVLPKVRKKIFLTYVECGTYARTARQYNVSAPTAKKYVEETIRIIKGEEND